MTREVYTIPPGTRLKTAWDLMGVWRIRHLPVVKGGKVVGILSDRDLLKAGTIENKGKGTDINLPDLDVTQAMSSNLIKCDPSTKLTDVATRMVEEKVDALLVVTGSASDELVGLVTTTDLLRLLIATDKGEGGGLPFNFNVHEADGQGQVQD
jgi:acetoin utilization protein AcuB